MEIIAHRRNTVNELADTPTNFGVEIDIRSWGQRLILNHEPYQDGVDFKDWLKGYKHQTLILNVKEEGLELEIVALMKEFNIKKYFFLDLSFPYLIKRSNQGIKEIAARYSPLESLETVRAIKDRIEWVWVDYVNGYPFTEKSYADLKSLGLKICLVSPELVTGNIADITSARSFLEKNGFAVDAVCTKSASSWSRLKSEEL